MMKGAWVVKALTKKALCFIPYGDKIDYFIQRRITKSLPHDDSSFLLQVEMSVRHIHKFQKYNQTPIKRMRLLEFGVGWDLVSAVTAYAIGVRHQVLTDISEKAHLDLINHTLEQCRRLGPQISGKFPDVDFRTLPSKLNSLTELAILGITYRIGKVEDLGFLVLI